MTPSTSPSPNAVPSSPACRETPAQAVASTLGSASTISSSAPAISGTTSRIQPTTTARAQGLSAVASGWCHRPGSNPVITGPMRE